MVRRAIIASAVLLLLTQIFGFNTAVLLAVTPETAWQTGVSYGQQRGTYGSDTETVESVTVAQVKRLFSSGSVGVAISYLDIAAEGTETVSGLGDTYVRGILTFAPAIGGALRLEGLAEVKIPTADPDQGLGTGENDYSAGIMMSRFLTDRSFLAAELGYTWLGDTKDVDFNDAWYMGAGIGAYLAGNWAVSAEYRYAQPSLAGGPDYKEAAVGVRWAGSIAIQAAVNTGFSDAAPDLGWTVGAYWRF